MRLWNKLASSRGETLTETLVAVLIVVLSSALLAGMITAASRINARASTMDEALYEAVANAETGKQVTTATKTVKVNVTVKGEPYEFDCNLCGDGDVPLYSYRIKPEVSPP